MFRNRLLKILALLMVLNILIIPLTTFTPQQQNKYKVYASEGIVDIRFYNAVMSMIGITAAGLATMSPSFSIPEADLVQMKDNFSQSLEADSVKKQAWLAAQTEYLAGGVAKTMSAVELAKIGVNDVYNNLKDYLTTNVDNPTNYNPDGTVINNDMGSYTITTTVTNINKLVNTHSNSWGKVERYYYYFGENTFNGWDIYYRKDFRDKITNKVIGEIRLVNSNKEYQFYLSVPNNNIYVKNAIYATALGFGLNILQFDPTFLNNAVTGTITRPNVINTTDTTIETIPTIPWIANTIPIGTIVTPAISAPYAGAVPIDVPITVPIDPPIDEPIEPPTFSDIMSATIAILAALTPISGILDNIEVGQATITDSITTGLTGVIDGIGDIAGTLTAGISTTLTDIQTSISSLLDPPTETLDLDKLKNLNSVLFTKFPFSIPFDFVSMISAFSSDPVAPVITIPFDMSDFGGEFTEVKMDLSDYNNIAAVARQIGFIGFVFFMLFNTRKLIWK